MEPSKPILRNDKGFPLLENGEIDWERTSQEKQAYLDAFEAKNPEGPKKIRRKPTNYTPPKKKRKKRK